MRPRLCRRDTPARPGRGRGAEAHTGPGRAAAPRNRERRDTEHGLLRPLGHGQDDGREHHRPPHRPDAAPPERHERHALGHQGRHRRARHAAHPRRGVLLYLDEIQYFNKKQQQSLLEFIEDGRITLIASTTENPYFYVYNALLSRSTVFEFKSVPPEEAEARRGAGRPARIRAGGPSRPCWSRASRGGSP